MNNEQILKKAIEKAQKNGYEFPFTPFEFATGEIIYGDNTWVYRVIFSHSFAKAFWGDRYMTTEEENRELGAGLTAFEKRWQYHLQQMVLEEEPLKYLERFL